MKTWRMSHVEILFLLAVLLLASCQAAPVPAVESTPTVDGESVIAAQIQNTLNNYNRGLRENDKTLFLSAIDSGNWVLREDFSANFDELQASGFPKTVKLGMTVQDVEPVNQELVLAHIQRDRDGWRADWYFRNVQNTWLISEPTTEEAGAPQMTTSAQYTFILYPINGITSETMAALMSDAEKHVFQDLGKAPAGKVEVTVYPSAANSPLRDGGISTWNFSPGEAGPDSIGVVAPASWRFGFYDPQAGWQPDIEILLTHELARIAYVRDFGNPGQEVDWLFEGLAEYVAGFDHLPEVTAAIQDGDIIPIVDTASAARKIDLAHFENLENWSLAYELAKSLVTFIVENQGGMETFWKLAKSYDGSRDMTTAIQDTLGTSYNEFDASWRKWLKEDYSKR